MRKYYLLMMLAGCSQIALGQPMSFEISAGNEHILYQHTISRPFENNSSWGIMNIANIIYRYQATTNGKNHQPNEIMNQAYLTRKLSTSITVMAGTFYSNATDIKASIALQFAKRKRDLLFVLVPRFDFREKESHELFVLLEYRPQIYAGLKLYARAQAMTNHGSAGHNRSYQRLRLGFDKGSWQFGASLNVEEYGPKPEAILNTGIFIRKEIF